MIDCGPNRMSARHLGTRIMTGFLEQIPLMYERMPHVAGSICIAMTRPDSAP
jgi:hypothetical protein